MTHLLSAIRKECQFLLRDVHGLALLFLLPTLFIVIMSLALQDSYASRSGAGIPVAIVDLDQTETSAEIISRLSKSEAFAFKLADALEDATAETVASGTDARFVITLPVGLEDGLLEQTEDAVPVPLFVTADVDRRTEAVFTALLRETLSRLKVEQVLTYLVEDSGQQVEDFNSAAFDTPVEISYAGGRQSDRRPSAVQQNVPAWLVFSIFFVAIPFSNTFIVERELGVQRRLQTTQLTIGHQFAGKFVPYFVINLLQVALMLAVGVWLVPLFGGERLELLGNPFALALVGAAISCAALSLALLIAVISRTTEQATMASGLGNILLAAIGGVMVPRFVMPAAMQSISDWSPMAWGVDGFLNVLLENGSFGDIMGPVAKLVGFSIVLVFMAGLVQATRRKY
jgi:ABC-2 type transport system permease protein